MGLNAFNHPRAYQVSYVFPPPLLVSLVLAKFLADHVKDQFRLLFLVAVYSMEVTWLPTVLKNLEDIPFWWSIIQNVILAVLVDWELKDMPSLYLNLWLL